MSFCKYCSNILRIDKNEDYDENAIQKIKMVDMTNILVNKLNAKESNYNNEENIYQVDFSLSELSDLKIDKKKFGSMTETEIRTELENLYNEMIKQNKNANLFNYKCDNCTTTYYLQPGTIIDSVNYECNNFIQDEIPEIRVQDQTLFRTKNFICINTKCISNTDKSDKIQREKEAVFYKLNHHNIKYICNQCNSQWGT